MNERPATPGFVLLLVALSSLLLALIIAPFAAAFFAAAVLAGVMQPLQARLARGLGGRHGLAAGVLTVGLTLTVVVPLGGLCVFVAQQATSMYREAAAVQRREGWPGLLERLPAPLQSVAHRLAERWPDAGFGEAAPAAAADAKDDPKPDPNAGTASLSGAQVATVTDIATGVLDWLLQVLVELGVLVVTLFFLLRQGKQLVDWVIEILPLSNADGARLVGEFRDVTRAVFAATVVTACVQTLIAGLGYLIAGIPYLAIALLLTFVCALIPVVGAALVVGGTGLLLLLDGDMGYGIFLLAWSVPVGLSDNVLKPWLTHGKLRLPGPVVLFAMLGGVVVFGAFGIVAGPLIVAFFLASLRLLRKEGLAEAP